MKICDVVTNSIWFDPRVKRQICEYSSYSDIDLVCVGKKDGKFNEEEIKKLKIPIKLIEVDKKYYSSKRNIISKIIREFLIIKRLRDELINTNADIIHANDLDALLPAYLASKKIHCKLIYDTHEIFLENNNIVNKKLWKLFWSICEKYIINKVDKVVCVSHSAGNYLKNKYKIDIPMVITNCARKNNIKVIEKTGTFKVLNHGQFYAGRGYDIMVEAAEQIKSDDRIQFILRGFGPMETELREKVEKRKLKNIKFDPPVKVDELIQYAAFSNVGLAITEPICLNFELSVSNKLFEYAAAGIPIIMSDIPEHRYLNEKYKIGLIMKKNSPTELIRCISIMLENPEMYTKFCDNVKKMTKEINWESEFSKLIEFERSIV